MTVKTKPFFRSALTELDHEAVRVIGAWNERIGG